MTQPVDGQRGTEVQPGSRFCLSCGPQSVEKAAAKARRGDPPMWVWGLVGLIAVAGLVVALALVLGGGGDAHCFFTVPAGSMADTIAAGDRVEVDTLAYQSTDPVRGDVIAFASPMEPEHGELDRGHGGQCPDSALVKRISALGVELGSGRRSLRVFRARRSRSDVEAC